MIPRGRARLFLALNLVLAALVAPPASAFLPGVLPADREEAVRALGFEGVPEPRAFKLPPGDRLDLQPFRLLVVLVEFPDVRADRDRHPPAAFNRLFFGSGGTTPSLADYYLANSGGRFRLTGAVTPWIRADSSYAWYTDEGALNGGYGIDPYAYPHNVQRLVEEVVERMRDTPELHVDWSDYDNNRDGIIDGLFLIHAGPGAEESAPQSGAADPGKIVAHQYRTSYEVIVPGGRVFDYAAAGEETSLGVAAHELGHLLGLRDLYQTGPLIGPLGPYGVGDWSLMGTGALLNGGRSPANLDAYSRAVLGFVEPRTITVIDGAAAVRFEPGAGTVLRLWGGADAGEYFLAEARFRSGFDQWLPGEGILVYHIDERIQTNSSSIRPRVAVVQSDGRDDLHTIGGNRGDAEDPYPSAFTGNDRLDDLSTPSSLSYTGGPSYVELSGMRRSGDGFALTARIASPPAPRIVEVAVAEGPGSNRNGIVERGEAGVIGVDIENGGRAVEPGTLSFGLAPGDPVITLEENVLNVPVLGDGEVRSIPEAFRFNLPATGPPLPPVVPCRVVTAYRTCLSCETIVLTDTLLLPLGVAEGHLFDFEGEGGAFDHEALNDRAPDLWHVTTGAYRSPSHAWSFGREDGGAYAPLSNAALVTPPFNVPKAGEMTFWHTIQAESLGTGRAWDGGVIEVSVSGGEWEAIQPVGGYPFTLETGSGNPLFGRGCFSGANPTFEREVVDLSAFKGQVVRLRFRFVSDSFTGDRSRQLQTGWIVDDVQFGRGTPHVTVNVSLGQPGCAVVEWQVNGGQAPPSWRVFRQADQPGAAWIAAGTSSTNTTSGSVTDCPPPGRYIYHVQAMEGDGPGLVSSSHPVVVPPAEAAPRFESLHPSPFLLSGPALQFSFLFPEGAVGRHYEIDLIDVLGRHVGRLKEGEIVDYRERFQWGGETPAGRVRAGLYFLRLKVEGFGPVAQRIMIVS